MPVNDLIVQTLSTMAGIAALFIFFRAVRTSWPQSYFAVTDITTQILTASLWRYLVFRTVPVLAVTFFAAASLRRAGSHDVAAPFAIALLHGVATNGQAAWTTVRFGRRALGFWLSMIQHVAAIAISPVIGMVGIWLARRDWAPGLVPTPEELSGTLWTAVVAAVLGAYIMRISGRPAYDFRSTAARGRRSISDALWNEAMMIALTHGADPRLVQAIMVTENLQRPPWFRRIENIKARLGLGGTYGIMQVRANRVISDRESIILACEGHLHGAVTVFNQGYPDAESVKRLARLHNDDPAFTGMVYQIYVILWTESQAAVSSA